MIKKEILIKVKNIDLKIKSIRKKQQKSGISGNPIQLTYNPTDIILQILLLHPGRLFQILQSLGPSHSQTQHFQNIIKNLYNFYLFKCFGLLPHLLGY
jgi:hypothetical protein